MGFEGADGKEGLIRGMKGERERERERREKVAGVGSDDPHHHHPRTTSSSASTLANEAGYYTVRPSFFRDVRALFFCVLLIGQSSKVVVCRPIVSECVLTFRLLPALRWRDRNSIELATRGSPASVSSSRLCYYTASHDRNNIVSHGRRSPGDGVRDFLRQLG